MLDFLRQLLSLRNSGSTPGEAAPILRAIVHSEVLTEIVRATGTPLDDLILQIVRAIVPKEV
ncbi:MAG: hypothetical protein FJ304_26635 [Planctomycetes bacterium]|nr:hypothetical protein [Planctomycetota bacterium]